MRHLLIPALLSVVLLPHSTLAQSTASSLVSGWRPYADIRLWEASDAVAVTKFDSDWSHGFSPRDGNNATLQRIRAGIGMENERWSIGWEVRQEASLDANREALEAVRLYKQRLDPAPNTRFDVGARFTAWSAQGLRVGHNFDGPTIAGYTPRLNISGAFYTRPRLRENEVSGSVLYTPAGTYSFNATQTDADSRNQYPFMRYTPNASGASLSLTMDLPLTDALSLQLKAEDLWSRIKWENLPVMQRTIGSDVTERDSNGYINYRPVLSGTNRQISKNFSIPRSFSALLAYRSGPWGASAQVERWSGVTIPTLSLDRHFGWGVLSASVETRFNTVGIGVGIGKFRLLVQADNLHPDRAKALGLQVSYCIANQ